ncbi:MAG TPA: methyltransferase domain-containing protein [Mycobacteriales bacterium]|nr:methyltransferase domain-containing protein [Mycobacteriales bacterium]
MGQPIELTFLPGLRESVTEEVRAVLPGVRKVRAVPGREDAVLCSVTDLRPVLSLRTVVAPFLALSFEVPRPKSLSSGEHFPRIVDSIAQAKQLNRADPLRTFRIEAAGSDSPVFRRLADQLAAATGLVPVTTDGDCVIRFRRSVEGTGWDVLVRLTKRPLSTRTWRSQGHPAAVNATIAAAMVRLTEPAATDRVANPMCGSGTLLIERLLAGPAAAAVGVDVDPAALDACAGNLASAGLTDRVRLCRGDITDAGWEEGGPFDVLLADPPWGDKTGRHETNEALHESLLRRASEVGTDNARMVVLTHEIAIMQRCLRRARDLWEIHAETRVFAKGHHPRIYLLGRKP